ncbi:MAG TPA: glycosyltransferase family 39 protein [Acidimicrobiales bacterium]|nr:glycosyltransferase family 39 protein [Acidimicrobiales bacterium]
MRHTSPPGTPALSRLEVAGLIAVVAAFVLLRFTTRSALWLDEALSVNIASLPLRDIPEALRHDGHPPLYYALLHGWMEVFGTGDVAVRALSGVLSVATLPLAWIAGRRRGGRVGAAAVLLVVAVTPFALRYATETRMYALVMLGVFAAMLLTDDLLEAFSWPRAVALSLVTAALLYSHYWTLWLGVSVGSILLVRAVRTTGAERRRTVRTVAALVGGVVLFVPWIPILLEQSSGTGTPWARPASPPRVFEQLVLDVGSGPFPEALLFSFVLAALLALAMFALPVPGSIAELRVDLRTVSGVRLEAVVAGLTLAVGVGTGYLAGATFAGRYSAAFLPFVFVVAGIGLIRLPSLIVRDVVACVLVVAALGGAYRNVTEERTQGEQLADAIDAEAASDDLVVFCPDQLGPSVDRSLDVPEQRVVFPTFDGPERIDWVDYAERNESADVAAFARGVLDRAGEGDVWLVWSADYLTLQQACPGLVSALGSQRAGFEVVPNGGSAFFEHAALWRFPAA